LAITAPSKPYIVLPTIIWVYLGKVKSYSCTATNSIFQVQTPELLALKPCWYSSCHNVHKVMLPFGLQAAAVLRLKEH
jgi:hypothetical protein